MTASFGDHLETTYAEAWRPNPGDRIVGEVVALDERTGDYDPYPIVTVRRDNGVEAAFHAFHTVAANELAKLRPRIGERIAIVYRGKVAAKSGTGSYHSYWVGVDRAPVELNWSRWDDERARDFVERPSDVRSDIPTGPLTISGADVVSRSPREALADELDGDLPY